MIRRALEAIRRWWRSGGRGAHAKPRYIGESVALDVYKRTLPRKPVSGRPPWETAPLPAICLLPIADPPALHPIVMRQLGASSVAEYIDNLFAAQPA